LYFVHLDFLLLLYKFSPRPALRFAPFHLFHTDRSADTFSRIIVLPSGEAASFFRLLLIISNTVLESFRRRLSRLVQQVSKFVPMLSVLIFIERRQLLDWQADTVELKRRRRITHAQVALTDGQG